MNDQLEVMRAFQSIALSPAAEVVRNRLRQMVEASQSRLANEEGQVQLYRAQGRYAALLEVLNYLDPDYLADMERKLGSVPRR